MSSFIPRLSEYMSPAQANELNPLVLAFVGDSVHTMYVRTRLVFTSGKKAGELHKLVTKEINATRQSEEAMKLMDIFDSEETDIFKRARNSHNSSSSKSADILDYRRATGFEAVLGFLYLTGRHERLEILLKKGEEL